MPESLKLKISERDDLADLLSLIPPWFIGALFWVGVSELVLKRLYPDDFIKLQTAILAADIISEMPPGVALVAVLYDTLYAVEITEGVTETLVSELAKTANKIIISIAKLTGEI